MSGQGDGKFDKSASDDKKWEVLSSREIFRTPFFQLRSDQCKLPDGRVMPNYFVCSFTPWVQVLALTPDHQAIMVRQYRHGIGASTLEFPGGAVSSHEVSEAEKAALRELREETGYTSPRVQFAGVHHPNPAFQNNELFTFIAWDCVKEGEQELDPFEDIEIIHVPVKNLPSLIYTGDIRHSLIVAGFVYTLPHIKHLIDI
ncbi:MAG TPA: NUDIX hydrolase [Bdellovibrionales bacterium]|nr:NUDIX hydrolase [Bdellovibrionales bacterium]